jgi:hypothetical protein
VTPESVCLIEDDDRARTGRNQLCVHIAPLVAGGNVLHSGYDNVIHASHPVSPVQREVTKLGGAHTDRAHKRSIATAISATNGTMTSTVLPLAASALVRAGTV